MENKIPTCGQLERQLSQTLQSIYRQQFGHSISKATCHLFTDKVAVIAEDTVTSVERILLNNSQFELAHDVRAVISKTFQAQIKQTVTDILQVEVVDIVSDSSLDSGYLCIFIFLDNAPKTRLTKVRSRREDRNSLDGDRNSLNGNRNSLNGNRNSLDGNRNSLDGDKNSLNGDKNSLDGDRNSLDGDKNSLDGDKNSLDGNSKVFQ